ncbi:hypothetical protein QYF61_012019 [Mycteria americana]|uniref:Uncharacterized protein n=1 Tax=Mycteria americana TaxID=33587 RepID=A0AAN7NNE4_MYCAM|nr:hypothetical protein QYF61_012019 [Mycteria americana]
MRPANQFLIHQTVHPSNPYLSNLERRMFHRGLHLTAMTWHALAFMAPSLHNQAAPLYSFQNTCPCFHCLCISFLPFSLTSRSRLIHADLLPSFPDSLQLGIESCCVLWRASLKIYQKGVTYNYNPSFLPHGGGRDMGASALLGTCKYCRKDFGDVLMACFVASSHDYIIQLKEHSATTQDFKVGVKWKQPFHTSLVNSIDINVDHDHLQKGADHACALGRPSMKEEAVPMHVPEKRALGADLLMDFIHSHRYFEVYLLQHGLYPQPQMLRGVPAAAWTSSTATDASRRTLSSMDLSLDHNPFRGIPAAAQT